MPGGGTRTFLEPDHYEAGLRQAQIEALIVPRGEFRARLTWAELHHLQVLRCEENSPRITYVQLGPGLAFVTFASGSEALSVWRGREMRADDIMFHSRGERLHESTSGPSVWNVIAMDPATLERYGGALSGKPFSAPAEGQVLQPSPRLAVRVRRLHAQICRLAETKSKVLSHPEVARAMEQALIEALVICLTTANARIDGYANRHHARIMIRFEEVLADRLGRPPPMSELCELIVVSDRTFRLCCAEFLDMSPNQYVLLRRLKEVRRVLRDANPDMVRVAEVAHGFGFMQLGRFAGRYRAAFGESPSATLQRVQKCDCRLCKNFPIFA
jgi:AraC-like DNA-binding protein